MSTPEQTSPQATPRLILTASLGSSATLHGGFLLVATLLIAPTSPTPLRHEPTPPVHLKEVIIPDDFLGESPEFTGAGGDNPASIAIATNEPEPKPEPEPEPKKITPPRETKTPNDAATLHTISARTDDKRARRRPASKPRAAMPDAVRGPGGGGGGGPAMPRGDGGTGDGLKAVVMGFSPEEGNVRETIDIKERAAPDLSLKIYQSEVVAAILDRQRYPAAARAEKLGGTVVVVVTVTAAGALTSARLAKPSGHAVLDQDALATARSVRSVPNPPPQWTQRNVRVRFTYP